MTAIWRDKYSLESRQLSYSFELSVNANRYLKWNIFWPFFLKPVDDWMSYSTELIRIHMFVPFVQLPTTNTYLDTPIFYVDFFATYINGRSTDSKLALSVILKDNACCSILPTITKCQRLGTNCVIIYSPNFRKYILYADNFTLGLKIRKSHS